MKFIQVNDGLQNKVCSLRY